MSSRARELVALGKLVFQKSVSVRQNRNSETSLNDKQQNGNVHPAETVPESPCPSMLSSYQDIFEDIVDAVCTPRTSTPCSELLCSDDETISDSVVDDFKSATPPPHHFSNRIVARDPVTECGKDGLQIGSQWMTPSLAPNVPAAARRRLRYDQSPRPASPTVKPTASAVPQESYTQHSNNGKALSPPKDVSLSSFKNSTNGSSLPVKSIAKSGNNLAEGQAEILNSNSTASTAVHVTSDDVPTIQQIFPEPTSSAATDEQRQSWSTESGREEHFFSNTAGSRFGDLNISNLISTPVLASELECSITVEELHESTGLISISDDVYIPSLNSTAVLSPSLLQTSNFRSEGNSSAGEVSEQRAHPSEEHISPIVVTINAESAENLSSIIDHENLSHTFDFPADSPDVLQMEVSSHHEAETMDSHDEDSNNEDTVDEGSRKRQRNFNNWKRNKSKLALDSGVAHLNVKNKPIRARALKKGCELCRYKCHDSVSEDLRKEIFRQFWNLKNKARQWDFIKDHMRISEPPSHRNDEGAKRMVTRRYYFKVSGTYKQVCRTMFLHTLDVSEAWCRTATKKIGDGHTISPDKRGCHSKVKKEVHDKVVGFVKEHISSFPKIPSHFCRAQTKRKYLDSSLSIKKMYKLYIVWMKRKYPTQKTCSERFYRDVFNNNFNLSFYKPKKDQCQLCSVYGMCTEAEKLHLKQDYDAHLANKTASREQKAKDKEFAKNNENCCYAIFDMQKNFNLPFAEIGSLYYSQKITVHNFTVYDGIRKQGFCYVWSEDEGKKGSNEIATGLLDFIDMMVQQGTTEFRFWSDNCGGQNKNQNLFSMYTHATSKYKVNIYHGYLETGHTQNEADSIHSNIDRATRSKVLFLPEEWYALIEASKQEGHPYIVKKIAGTIKNIDALSKEHQDWKVNGAHWNKVSLIHVNPQNPGKVYVKHSHTQENFLELKVNKTTRGRPVNLANFVFPIAYQEPLQLKQNKLKALATLCKKLIIPTSKQAYYRALRGMPELPPPEILENNGPIDADDPLLLLQEINVNQEEVDDPDEEGLEGVNGVDYEAWLEERRSAGQ